MPWKGSAISLQVTKRAGYRGGESFFKHIATLPGDTIQVPGIWANVRALKSKRGGIDTELDLSNFAVLKVYCDLETTGLSIYTASILSIGMICYLEDERLGEFESYVHNKSDFPMASTKVHGIYPIAAPHPDNEISKLVGAPTLTQMNENALAFLNRQKDLVRYMQHGHIIILNSIQQHIPSCRCRRG